MTHSMKRHSIPLILAALVIGLAGCNTVGGAGKDVSSAGKAVTGAANDVKEDIKN